PRVPLALFPVDPDPQLGFLSHGGDLTSGIGGPEEGQGHHCAPPRRPSQPRLNAPQLNTSGGSQTPFSLFFAPPKKKFLGPWDPAPVCRVRRASRGLPFYRLRGGKRIYGPSLPILIPSVWNYPRRGLAPAPRRLASRAMGAPEFCSNHPPKVR